MLCRTCITLAATLTTLFAASFAFAQIIPGNYAPGAAAGMKSAIAPPPGTRVVDNATLFYSAREFVDGAGDALPTAPIDALANRTIFGYITNTRILGGDLAVGFVLPFANTFVRPAGDARRDFGLGDIILQPLGLSWHSGEWHSQVNYAIWTPTGRFSAGARNNTGKGLYSQMLAVGTTWLQQQTNAWAASVNVRYEVFGRQDETDIRPGDVLTIDGGIGREVGEAWDLGLTYYYSTQTTREKGSAPGTDTTRYRYYGLGPEINWRPASVAGLQIGLRSYYEFDVRNTSRGNFTVLQIGYGF